MIKVFNCGHDSHHKKPCDILHPTGLNNHLFLLIKQHAWVYIDGKKRPVEPNSLLLFPPNTPIHYGCDTAGYNDDWIHFDFFDDDRKLLDLFSFPYGVILHPRDFRRLSDYAKIISDEFHSNGLYCAYLIDQLMHIFLYALDDELKKTAESSAALTITQKYYREFAQIRTQIYNAPSTSWSVNRLADTLCLSSSHFQHLYKRFFNCSCQHDIICARIALAKFYLTTTNMPVCQLSIFCGYESDLHFMRQFKKYVGVTPSEYRIRTRGSALQNLPDNS
ncbi:MAG: AraC family transcriptional regulator [Lachnospiraceae bacterium]|nr:AraC family transcriptional regulator [Lachnospiraceae bacterium]